MGQTAQVAAPPSSTLDTSALRKGRGAFFTPEPVARLVTDWALRTYGDHVLEPSCGEAAFLLSAVDRLAALSTAADGSGSGALDGVELHAESARAAQQVLDGAGVSARVKVADFFTVTPTGSYDAVIGNPPYVRYQDFSGKARSRSRSRASCERVFPSWAAISAARSRTVEATRNAICGEVAAMPDKEGRPAARRACSTMFSATSGVSRVPSARRTSS